MVSRLAHLGLRAAALLALAVGSGVALGQAIGWQSPLLVGAAALAVMMLALLASTFWWLSIDEAARDAHKTAWFWGASFGMGFTFAATFALASEQGASLLPRYGADGVGYVILGVMLCLLPQVIGYAFVWAGWWICKR